MDMLAGAKFLKGAVSAFHGAQSRLKLGGDATVQIDYPLRGSQSGSRDKQQIHALKFISPRTSTAGQTECAHYSLSLTPVMMKLQNDIEKANT